MTPRTVWSRAVSCTGSCGRVTSRCNACVPASVTRVCNGKEVFKLGILVEVAGTSPGTGMPSDVLPLALRLPPCLPVFSEDLSRPDMR
eukprot:5516072-Amphidinium_carterae.1